MRVTFREHVLAIVLSALICAQGAAQNSQPELVIQTGHTSSVFALAASPDGRLLASGSADSTVRIWDAETGHELRVLSGHSAIVNAIAFSPDGHILASGSYDHSIKLWDVTTGKELRTIVAHDDPVVSVAFGPDGQWLASASWSGIKIWDTSTGGALRDLSDRRRAVSPVVFSRDGKIFASSNPGGSILLRDANSGRKLHEFSSPAHVDAVAFSPDGRLLATAGKEIIVWEVASSRQVLTLAVQTTTLDHPFGVNRLIFSPDGKTLIAGNWEKNIYLWDVATGQNLQRLDSPINVDVVAESPAGDWLASAGYGDAISIWDPRSGKLLRSLSGDVQMSLGTLFAADGRKIFNGAASGFIGDWDLSTGRPGRSLTGHQHTVTSLHLSPDGKLMATASWDHTIKLWNLATAVLVKTFAGHTDNVYTVAFSPDGKMLASGSLDMTVRLWDVATGQELRKIDLSTLGPTLIKGSNDQIASVVFSPDGKVLACTNQRATIKLFDLASGAELRTLKGQSQDAAVLAYSPDGKILASGSYDTTLRLWDAGSGRELHTLQGHHGAVNTLAFSHDGRWLASGSNDNAIAIWDVASAGKLRTLSGHTSQVWSVNFSPDDRWLASSGLDGSTRIWDAATGELRAVLIMMNDRHDWLVATPDGLFDGSPAAWQQILWRFNNSTADVVPVEMFFNDFYHPGLLADIFAGKHPKAKTNLAALDRRLPSVNLRVLDEDHGVVASRLVKISLQVAEAAKDSDHPQGSGARDVRLFRNGSLVKFWHGDVLNGTEKSTLEAEIPIVAGKNRLTAYAFNHDNVKSPDASVTVTGAESLKRKGTAYILAVGINQYASADWNLHYAASDARDFAGEVERSVQVLDRFQTVKTVLLLDADATKANLTMALERLAGRSDLPSGAPAVLSELTRAQPEDAIFVFYAGHGTSAGSHFYLIPHDLGFNGRRDRIDEEGASSILRHSLSDEELESDFEEIDASEEVLIVDACRSGQALQSDDPRQGPMNSKGLAQLAYDKGMYILTASQGYQAALETTLYQHGLLTYALIDLGLKSGLAGDDPKDGQITLREWLDFATQEVPQMQLQAMEEANRRGEDLAIVEGEQKIKNLQQRTLQHPRVFYRREPETQPFILATSVQ